MKLEHYREKLLPRSEYYRRLLRSLGFGVGITVLALGVGVAGYCYFAHLSFVDGLLNASMILFSEGPVDKMDTTGGKVFASFYALFSGIAYITIVGVVFAPAFHRFLHRFHMDVQEDETEEDQREDAQENQLPKKSDQTPRRRR